MNKLNYRYKTKFIILFSAVLMLSFFLSLPFTLFVNNSRLQQEMAQQEYQAAVYAYELAQKTDLTLAEIAEMVSNSVLLSVSSPQPPEIIDSELLAELDNLSIVAYQTSLLALPTTLIKIQDQYLTISVRRTDNTIRSAGLRVMLSLSFALFFCMAMTLMSAGRMTNPVTELSSAMQQVSRGDFTVRLPVKGSDEVSQLKSNFNQMVTELQSTEYLQKDFTSSVSHEFKTPIAAITGYAKLLQDDSLDKETQKEYTQIILTESQRLSHLSANLLRLSKLENGQRLEAKPYALDEQLRQAVVLLQPEWDKKNLQWELSLDEVTYCGDQELMSQVWINLLQNAIKFSPEHGKLTIALYATDQIKVRIKDEGSGMTPEVMKHIFDKFYQGDAAHHAEGNGLGLSLVHKIVELSGGTVSVKSEAGQGSTFMVQLPLSLS